MAKLVDLSHTLADGMSTYPGFPRPRIGPFLDHEESRSHYGDQAEFYIGRLDIVTTLGTYLDAPFHRYPHGADLSQLPLEAVAGLPGLALDAIPTAGRAVTVDCRDSELRGRAVLVRTGWDRRWGTDSYWEQAPYLSGELLDRLIGAGAALAGVDFWNVDNTEDLSRPAHTRLLAAGILVVENLANLSALPRDGFRFSAVPPRLIRGPSFPVRAFAEVNETADKRG